jgi:coenzyme F420-reducing hydrogenase beta subunit
MQPDNEGFINPVIDESKCINCNLCREACPVLKTIDIKRTPDAYACYNNDEAVLMSSSSGGIFTLIAEAFVKQGGVVFGAVFDKDFNVIHAYTDSLEDIVKFRGSKYVQSNTGNTFSKAEEFLKAGRKVLFSGTPCQIGGLHSYLRKDYENLLCVDFICHGVPSPKVWSKYIAYQKKLHQSEIKSVSFRDKTEGWDKYSLKITFENEDTYRQTSRNDYYMKTFSHSVCLRKSCYNCRFRKLYRQSDITLADFWGIKVALPEMYKQSGVSLVVVNSELGKLVFENLKDELVYRKIDFDLIPEFNKAMVKSPESLPWRNKFFRQLDKICFEELEKYCKERFSKKVKLFLKAKLRAIIEKMGLLETIKNTFRKK